MKTTIRFALAATVLSISACGARELAPPPPPEVTSSTVTAPDRVETTNTVTVTAVVTAIDRKRRLVTLRGADGEEQRIFADENVRNLAQVRKGDEVSISYYESTVFQLRKKGEAQPGAAMVEEAGRAELGQKPGAVGARATTVTATVVKMDKKKPSITLKGPDDETFTLPVKDAARLDAVRIGDLIEITYSEAMAIAVEPPAKKTK